MSTSAEFVFAIPTSFSTADAFVAFLATDLGLNLFPPEGDRHSWSGRHLGFSLSFEPDHKKYDDPVFVNDGQEIRFETHRSSIGLSGRGPIGDVIVPAMLNIGMALCYFHDTDGYLLADGGDLIAHIEWNPSKSLFWNIRAQIPFNRIQLQGMYGPQ